MNEFIKNFGIPENLKEMDIPSLTKKIVSFGEETSYLPLQYKKIWFRAMNPTGNIRYTVLSDTEEACTVEAKVYQDKNDMPDAYIGVGIAIATRNGCGDNTFMTPMELRVNMLQTARGLAASKALADAGYGLQFYGDLIDPETAIAEKQQEEIAKNTFEAETLPEAEAPKKARKPRATKAVEEATLEPVTVSEPEPIPEPAPIPEIPSVEEKKSTMSLEDARSQIATLGPLKDKTLGEIEGINPAYFVFLRGKKAEIPPATYEALFVIAENNEVIKRRFDALSN